MQDNSNTIFWGIAVAVLITIGAAFYYYAVSLPKMESAKAEQQKLIQENEQMHQANVEKCAARADLFFKSGAGYSGTGGGMDSYQNHGVTTLTPAPSEKDAGCHCPTPS